MHLKPITDDLQARRPVWLALSDMFLDTDTALSRHWRVQVLASSPYSLPELEEILVREVYPVCGANLLSVAGEWAGFDADWLQAQITHRAASRFRVFDRLGFGRIAVRWSAEWRETKRGVQASRAAPAA